MKNFKIKFLGRNIEIDFNHKIYVTAKFNAQSTSFACQGNWFKNSISIKKENYSLEALKSKILEEYNTTFY